MDQEQTTNPTNGAGAAPNPETTPPSVASQPAMPSPGQMPSTTPVTSADSLPAAEPQVTTGMPPTMPAQTGSKKKMGLIALIVAAAVVLLGAASAAAYFTVILPNRPENVLKAALANMLSAETKSVYFDGEINVTDTESDMKTSGSFKGASDGTGKLDMSMQVDAVVTKLTFDARSVDGKSLFFRIGGLNGLSALLGSQESEAVAPYASIIDSVNNQWYEVNESLLSSLGYNSSQLTEEQAKQLAQAYSNHPFVVVKEVLPNEKIGDKESFHYKIVADKTQLKAFIKAVKDLKIDAFKMTDEEFKIFNTEIDKVDFSKYPVDLWIAKDTKLPSKVAFNFGQDTMSMNMSVTFHDYNKPVTVEKPEDAKSVLELIGQISGAMNGLFPGALDESSLLEQGAADSGISL